MLLNKPLTSGRGVIPFAFRCGGGGDRFGRRLNFISGGRFADPEAVEPVSERAEAWVNCCVVNPSARPNAREAHLGLEHFGRREGLSRLRGTVRSASRRRFTLQGVASVTAGDFDRAFPEADQACIYPQTRALHRRGERRK